MRLARLSLLICCTGLLGATIAPATQPAGDDPIRQLLWGRKDVFGDSYPYLVDAPLYPGRGDFLLAGEPHKRMMALLDDVLAKDINQVAPNPRLRALMQSELWQVFDYTSDGDKLGDQAHIELRKKLVAAIRKLALTKKQILAPPDNLESSPLPDAAPDVEDPHAGWVGRGDVNRKMVDGPPFLFQRLDSNVAPAHTAASGGRSVFGVFIWFPKGPDAATAFLRRIESSPAATQPGQSLIGEFDHPSPQFPAGTRLALLRKMVLIDSDMEPVCSPIVQSVQVRTFIKIGDHAEVNRDTDKMRMQEFVLDAEKYAAGQRGTLHAVAFLEYEPMEGIEHPALSPYDERFHGPPPPDFRLRERTLNRCYTCHSHPGIDSMHSMDAFFGGTANLKPFPATFDHEIEMTVRWKQDQASWGLLQGYWESLPR